MVVIDGVQQFFLRKPGTPPISAEDVMLFVNRDDGAIEERFRHVGFLPAYYSEAERRLLHYRARGVVDDQVVKRQLEFMGSDDFRFRKNDGRNIRNNYETAEMFLGLAFQLFELLQNSEEHAIGPETLDGYGVTRNEEIATIKDGEVISTRTVYTFSYEIPSCDYLQFVADGCERIGGRPIYTDCYLSPLGDEGENDPLIGWVASKNGAMLDINIRVPEGGSQSDALVLGYLLKALLDLHLSGAQMVTYGVGEYSIVAKDALTALWVKLREELAGGRAGVCRVCGKHFIAHDERKEKARYCEPRGACSQAFMRTKRVLSLVNEGRDVDESARQVKGIGVRRVADIASRNRYVLGKEFPNVDFDTLMEGR